LLRAILADDSSSVDQALRGNDRVADSNRLERLGEQRAARDRPREGDVVVSKDIACESFKRLVELAGSVEETSLK